jgi:hypothetical protein
VGAIFHSPLPSEGPLVPCYYCPYRNDPVRLVGFSVQPPLMPRTRGRARVVDRGADWIPIRVGGRSNAQ